MNADPSQFRLPGAEEARKIRAVMDAAGLSEAGVLQALGIRHLSEYAQLPPQVAMNRVTGGTPLHTLIRLFLMGLPVPVMDAERAVAPMSLDEWVNAGLIVPEGMMVGPGVQLYVTGKFIVANDMPRRVGDRFEIRPDAVMSIGPTTLSLANLLIRRRVGRALDVGTGCGFLGLTCALHSERVICTDINPRAVEFTRFNAGLNGLANVEARAGSLLEPVADDQFDLIVSNPPFVISPEKTNVYRDSGMHGDQFCQELFKQAARRLKPGGFCQALFDWAHIYGDNVTERLRGWFEGLGCDVLVLHATTLDPVTYAANWARQAAAQSGMVSPQTVEADVKRYVEYYQRERIQRISHGLLTMRKIREGEPARQPWFHIDDFPPNFSGFAGDQVLRFFAGRDFAGMVPDQAMLTARLRPAPEVRVINELAPSAQSPRGWAPSETTLRLSRGLMYTLTIDPPTARLVMGCDGKRTLREVIAEIPSQAGQGPEQHTATALGAARKLIQKGVLVPIPAPGAEPVPELGPGLG
ncbi:MAG: methyltransferase [Phycisphaerales bacterium]|nr:methyltransferase [Phycisphaerales bacterium]